MPITSRDAQPGVAQRPPGGIRAIGGQPSGAIGDAPEPATGRRTSPSEPVPSSVGIVFVHGIGSQGPGETFLDWSAPIVAMLRAWRSGEGHPGDPVVRSHFSFNAADPPLLEVAIPAAAGVPPSSWLITEAWWAADLRAPGAAAVIAYLRLRLRRLIAGIADGYRSRQATWNQRRASSGGGTEPAAWSWIDALDRIQARAFSLGLLVAPLTLAGSLLLAGYGLLRRVPIGPIRDFAELRIIDSFLVDWFGDLPVLLDDPVQVANVRSRVADAIDRLRAEGADALVLVAHSGGAIVAFETLLDPVYLDRPVDKLVTLGQGLSLGWRLESDPIAAAPPPGDRLLGDLGAVRPSLRWVDVWASYDPAPAGPLRPVDGVPLDVLDPPDADAATDGRAAVGRRDRERLVVENRPVTNRMNVLDDHGAYWDNDEGFLVPLLRHLDAARGPANASRFYRDPVARADRIERRRERVAVLAAWDWLCALGAAAALAVLVLAALAGRPTLASAGASVGALAAVVPGHELVTGPVDAYGRVVGGLAEAAGVSGLAATVGGLGPTLLGSVLVAVLFVALAAVGNGRWERWDRRERAATLTEVPTPVSRQPVVSEGLALVGGLLGLWLAVVGAGFDLGWPIVVVVVASAGFAGLAVRLIGAPTPAPSLGGPPAD